VTLAILPGTNDAQIRHNTVTRGLLFSQLRQDVHLSPENNFYVIKVVGPKWSVENHAS
jgi:hypothetical protein